jgi:hypothetical protein
LALKGNENHFIFKNNKKEKNMTETEDRKKDCLTILHIFMLHAFT